jgi:hypothetical protein
VVQALPFAKCEVVCVSRSASGLKIGSYRRSVELDSKCCSSDALAVAVAVSDTVNPRAAAYSGDEGLTVGQRQEWQSRRAAESRRTLCCTAHAALM